MTKVDEALIRISKDELEKYYSNHSREDVLQYFNISVHTFCKLKEIFGIKKVPSIIEHAESVNVAELRDYMQNHTVTDAATRFNISRWTLQRILDKCNIPSKSTHIYTSYENICAKYSVDELRDILKQSNNTVADKLNISSFTVGRLRQLIGMPKRSTINEILMSIDKDELIKYYAEHNHTDTAQHFNISSYALDKLIEYYGIHKNKDASVEQIRRTKIERYGTASYTNQEKSRYTRIIRYGSPNYNNFNKGKLTRIKNAGSLAASYYAGMLKQRKTLYDRYGTLHRASSGVNGSNSKPNRKIAELLDQNKLTYTQEFPLSNYSYDFQVGNNLIEVNPSSTHNVDWSPFHRNAVISADYHQRKSKVAEQAGYRCIHIWDWDNPEKVIQLLQSRAPLYARKCELREIDKTTCKNFLNEFHLQGTCNGQIFRYGLYYNENLMQVMTFGKARYNKSAEYELLRLCTRTGYYIVGGAEKLFAHFIAQHPKCIIVSYCDRSKFNGNVYSRLGFKLIKVRRPSATWVHKVTGERVTDNLLRQHGFDRLFGNKYGYYGKGTSNYQLMLDHGFVRVYDCGQACYMYKGS